MEHNRRLGLVIIAIGLVIIGLIIYFVFGRKTATEPTVSELTPVSGQVSLPTASATGTTTPSDKPRNYQQYDLSTEKAHQTNANDLEKIAMAAAERIGSFSSQSDYGNFTDLKIFMTTEMRAWVDKTVADYRSAATGGTAYYGIETRALTAKAESFNEEAGQAKVVVMTERRASTEAIGGGEAYQQEITFDFIKKGSEWLIDGAYWKK